MPPPRKKQPKEPTWSPTRWKFSDISNIALDLMLTPSARNLTIVSVFLILVEIILNFIIINKVPYTEIDWIAYMQEVAPVLHNGTMNYSELKGDTGPLVYPAGFVWVFSGLYMLTENGTNLRLAQYLFAFFYILQLTLVFRIMIKTEKTPPFVLAFMSLTSYRIHSIFVLRLFNDPIAMIFLYAAINLFISDCWSLGSLFFSLAVSVKMNILLFAPGLFFAYLATQSYMGTLKQLFLCGSVQVLLALPFLFHDPVAYIKGAFDLGRVFMFKWTVNWRFLPEDVFVSRDFHIALLLCHILTLIWCIPKWWKMLSSYEVIRRGQGPTWSVQLLVLPLFMSNFVGIVFARSLHYQFYVWYYHQLHYLLWCTKMPTPVRLLILGLIELSWNTYPSTNWSSALLHLCHGFILIGLLFSVQSIMRSASQMKVTNKKQK